MPHHTQLPDALNGYRIDDALARRYYRRTLFAFGVVVAFAAATIIGLVWAHDLVACITFSVLAIAALAMFIYRQQKKTHRVRCSSCAASMSVVDAPFPKNALSPKMDGLDGDFRKLFLVSFQGRDGEIYRISSSGDSDAFHFYRLHQRW